MDCDSFLAELMRSTRKCFGCVERVVAKCCLIKIINCMAIRSNLRTGREEGKPCNFPFSISADASG